MVAFKEACMAKLVNDFKALSLAEQHEVYPLITAAYQQAKEARRQELEAEIKGLGFKPGEGRKAPAAAVKFRSKKNPALTYGGRGAIATWLKEEMAETGLPLEAFKA
jgi:DNA-binding protein H-NS